MEKTWRSSANHAPTSSSNDDHWWSSRSRPVEDKPARPFSVFTRREKWALVAMSSVAGIFSPLTVNIYFPAIPDIAQHFNVSIVLMNLTVTGFMVAQGIAPVCWAPLADTKGRRPVYLTCLFLLTISCIGLALVPQNAWWLLMALRVFQAAGSAATIALGSGVVSDIAEPDERGGFVALVTIGPMVGPTIGPVIGGVLDGLLGWRWIFWFLAIFSSLCLVFMFLFFPETLRLIVDDGSLPPPWWNRPLIPIIGPYRHRGLTCGTGYEPPPPPSPSDTITGTLPLIHPTRINPFLLLAHPDVVLILFANGFAFAAFICVPAMVATLLEQAHPTLSETEVGLCFLPAGIGALAGTALTGKFLDWSYQRAKRELMRPDCEQVIPIEKARLGLVPVYLFVLLGCSIGFGWSVSLRAPLAVPLSLLFTVGFAGVGLMSAYQTLLMDLFPTQGSSTTGLSNLVRWTLGAAAVSVIDIIVDAVGAGWTYVILGAIVGIITPALTLLVVWRGPKWRLERLKKLIRMEEERGTD